MTPRNTDYWLCQVLGWGAYTGFALTFVVAQAGWNSGIVVRYGLFLLYSIALTHGLRRVVRQRKWLDLPLLRILPRLMGAAAVVGTIQTLLVVAIDRALGGSLASLGQTPYLATLWLTFVAVTFLWSCCMPRFAATARRWRCN